jgi:hypothetical protein
MPVTVSVEATPAIPTLEHYGVGVAHRRPELELAVDRVGAMML